MNPPCLAATLDGRSARGRFTSTRLLLTTLNWAALVTGDKVTSRLWVRFQYTVAVSFVVPLMTAGAHGQYLLQNRSLDAARTVSVHASANADCPPTLLVENSQP